MDGNVLDAGGGNYLEPGWEKLPFELSTAIVLSGNYLETLKSNFKRKLSLEKLLHGRNYHSLYSYHRRNCVAPLEKKKKRWDLPFF